MDISLDQLSTEIIESTFDNEDEFGGRHGWYWHECHHRPRGPFGSPAEAIFDFGDWVEKRYPTGTTEPPASAANSLAQDLLQNADGFLRSAEEARANAGMAELVLSSSCYALELVLKSYLLSRGKTDDWNREQIGHDLRKALREAIFLGLPHDDARIDRFLKIAADAYARHELMQLARERPNLLSEIDYVFAVRVLFKEVTARFGDDLAEGMAQSFGR